MSLEKTILIWVLSYFVGLCPTWYRSRLWEIAWNMPGLSAALKIIPASRISRSNSEMLQMLSAPCLGKRFHFSFQIAIREWSLGVTVVFPKHSFVRMYVCFGGFFCFVSSLLLWSVLGWVTFFLWEQQFTLDFGKMGLIVLALLSTST